MMLLGDARKMTEEIVRAMDRVADLRAMKNRGRF